MKKPSTQILDIIRNAPKDSQGNSILSPSMVAEIDTLTTKVIDRRDQQRRKNAPKAKKAAR